jgi:peptidoglycan/xylan/chitin deacetylase (PgdA/CDA1 family)
MTEQERGANREVPDTSPDFTKRSPRIRNVRSLFRHLLLSTLGSSYRVLGRMKAGLARDRIHLVYLHHVFEDEVEPFRRLVRYLAGGHRYLAHSEAVERILAGRNEEPCISFSFDDGLKNCLDAARILEEYGARGCFYVCSDMVGETDPSVLRHFCETRLCMPPSEFMDWADLESLLKRGHEIGSHTKSHPDLARVPEDLLAEEIEGSRELLRARLGNVDHFAWPYGTFGHFRPEAARFVFRAGYRSCASAVRGCHVPEGAVRPEDLCLRREHAPATIPPHHLGYFMASSSGRTGGNGGGWPPGYRP